MRFPLWRQIEIDKITLKKEQPPALIIQATNSKITIILKIGKN